jgi:hypothetical protein
MTSQRKIQANKSNSQRSSGPKTTFGKRQASRNSRKQGFAGKHWQQIAGSAEVEALARVLCEDRQNPALLVQARIIAQHDLLRRAIRERKLSLVNERMTQAEYSSELIGRLLLRLFARFPQQLPRAVSLRQPYSRENIVAQIEQYFDGEDLVALRTVLKEFFDQQPVKAPPFDENKALEVAAPEIGLFERYECRAWTRERRAMRNFIAISRSTED